MLDENRPEYDAYSRAAEAIARARETEGTSEAGLWRTAVVESAAAITEALFALTGNYQYFDPDDLTNIGYRLSEIADAIEKLAPKPE
jgi:hypothetical protein